MFPSEERKKRPDQRMDCPEDGSRNLFLNFGTFIPIDMADNMGKRLESGLRVFQHTIPWTTFGDNREEVKRKLQKSSQ
jgi:hypothetical protein